MMHMFMRKGPWFRAKSHGFGTGLPIVWEGGLFMALHVAMITGLAAALRGQPVAMTIAVILAGLAPMPIYRAKTEGGWRWR
ncbi:MULTISPECIES: hypothetical protein [unclassified Sphingopyxis]|uniref:hypothetical protein n=1 Tax=unclassified Sphingopyxis TaxID=2614943 RepID=UPI002864B95E|nr:MULTISPECIES: hypothetical protein [unclassified Sphingopyxis]MDR6833846.1 hypothetical protein [Sphingopyxis sp. BE122]MDR7226115.1 hypothetical protein [Sphingopyxis sp. BE259]